MTTDVTQIIPSNTLSILMLIINKNMKTTQIREWLNKLWNIWTEFNAATKAAVEDLVATGSTAQ